MRKWGYARAASLALAAMALCAPAAAEPAAAISEITAALESGNAKQAGQLADAALADTGLAATDRGRLLAERGVAHEAQSHHDDALVDLTQAIEMHVLPPDEQARALFTRGAILDGQGHTKDAIGDYSAALILAPHFAPALNNRANAYRRQNRIADAKRDYLASLAAGNLAPEYSYYGLGQIAEAEGNAAGARGFYGQAAAANPNYALASDRLAALGGAPDTAVADSGIIHLRPPTTAATEPVVLKPPGTIKATMQRAPRVVPAAYGDAGTGSGLRPAMDAPGNDAKGSNGREVQLGAWRSQEEADQGWTRALGRSAGLLDGMTPHIVAVELPGKGRYYRLRTGPSTDGPAKLCAALAARGVDCIPVRD